MPRYRVQVVHHGSHVAYGGETYATKAIAREHMRHFADQQFPGATVKAAGSDDALLIVREGVVTQTVSIEIAPTEPTTGR